MNSLTSSAAAVDSRQSSYNQKNAIAAAAAAAASPSRIQCMGKLSLFFSAFQTWGCQCQSKISLQIPRGGCGNSKLWYRN